MGCPSAILNIGGVDHLQAGQWSSQSSKQLLDTNDPRHSQSGGVHGQQRMLLYKPRSNTERNALLAGTTFATIPVAEQLFRIDGADSLAISGISFQHAAWNAPSSNDGYLERLFPFAFNLIWLVDFRIYIYIHLYFFLLLHFV